MGIHLRSFTVSASVGGGSFTTASPLTGPLAATAANALPLHGVKSFRVTVGAASGQTLSGAGTVEIWIYNPAIGLWTQNASLVKSITVVTLRHQVFPDDEVGNGWWNDEGWFVYPRANTATVGGGATGDVRIDAVCA